MDTIERLGQLGVVPVVKIDDARHAPRLAQALISGGLPCVEITFRTAAAVESIRSICVAEPEMIVGAGTVLTISQAKEAAEAGARFIVSPGFDSKVVDWCLKRKMPIIPGIATATEALMALNKGLSVLKFFPCEALGGIPMLKAISAALVGVKYVPTGGVSAANMTAYLQLPFVHAVAGSWLATSKMIEVGAFDDIARFASEAVGAVQEVRIVGEPV
jgi:2-dehydro-3-deoxyphosphogluconate aldolase/(4S)-4-hydroxy-2-oxoglutarate aldolase